MSYAVALHSVLNDIGYGMNTVPTPAVAQTRPQLGQGAGGGGYIPGSWLVHFGGHRAPRPPPGPHLDEDGEEQVQEQEVPKDDQADEVERGAPVRHPHGVPHHVDPVVPRQDLEHRQHRPPEAIERGTGRPFGKALRTAGHGRGIPSHMRLGGGGGGIQPPGSGLCLKGRGAIGEIPELSHSGHRGRKTVGGRLLAVGNAVGAGVGVWECL